MQNVQLDGISSPLNLFFSFSYFLNDPVRGDQFSKWDRRTLFGGSATHVQSIETKGVGTMFAVGLQSRMDFINDVGLSHSQPRRTLETVRNHVVRQNRTGVYVESEGVVHFYANCLRVRCTSVVDSAFIAMTLAAPPFASILPRAVV